MGYTGTVPEGLHVLVILQISNIRGVHEGEVQQSQAVVEEAGLTNPKAAVRDYSVSRT